MSRLLFFMFLVLFLSENLKAQSRIALHGGCTVSNLRTYYPPSTQPGPYFSNLIDFPLLVEPYGGIEYEYDYKQWRFSTGLSVLVLGSGRFIIFDVPWRTYYWTVPLMVGHRQAIHKDWALVVEGGLEFCYEPQSGLIITGQEHRKFNLNAAVGIELEWRRFCLGVRGHWGLNEFREVPPVSYYHTGVSVYLGFTLWDHAKTKARRAAKRQANHSMSVYEHQCTNQVLVQAYE